MEMILSKYIGFCSGVKRCINLVEKELKNSNKVFTYGELLHNEQELKRLEDLGVKIVKDIKEIKDLKNISLVLRSHGVKKDLTEKLKNIKVIDGTCPNVKRNQKIVEEYSLKGYDIIIFGNPNHPEIEALVSYVNPKVNYYIINSLKDLKNIKITDKKFILLSQTTKSTQEYKKLKNNFKNKKNIQIFDTICKETILREKEIKSCSKDADCVLIIGSKNSSNTMKLFNIAKEYNKNVFLIDNLEFDNSFFKKFKKIRIFSGASTPMWFIQKVLEKLKLYQN